MIAAYGRKACVAAAALSACLAVTPSRAGDDGQASLFSGLVHTFHLTKDEAPDIDYRERSRLVIPPKMTLPPPSGSVTRDGVWPQDVEKVRAANEKKLETNGASARDVYNGQYQMIHPWDSVKVTTSGFDKQGTTCRIPDPKTGQCPEKASPAMNWNPLTWVGIEKKPKVVLGPEPEREDLVDPPKGYRAPVEGVGAKVDN